MQHLLQPRILNLACGAAAASALACYPQLALWLHRPAPIWYLECTIFISSIMLWGFVFAWHQPCTNRPVVILKPERSLMVFVTVFGLAVAAGYYLWMDPLLRAKFPQEYPADFQHWLVSVPFTLGLSQLFLVFAPFDWSVRLFKSRWVAAILTGLFGVAVQAVKMHSLPGPVSPALTVTLLALRGFSGFLLAIFYFRGGLLPVWWWTFLFESRLLLHLE